MKVVALAPCPEAENGNQQIPSNADRVVVRLSEGPIDASSPIYTTIRPDDPGPTGKVELPKVPEGSGIRLDAVACNEQNEATWAGSALGISVQAGAKVPVDLYMTPLNAVTCAGRNTQIQLPNESSSMLTGHAFAAVAPSVQGALVLGGFANYDPAQDSRRLTATAAVASYDASTSSFSDAGTLDAPRAMAGATLVSGGFVLVVGGTVQMALKSVKKPPLSVLAEHAPKYAVEIFQPPSPNNPQGSSVSVSTCTRFPNLPAVAVLDETTVLAVGGVGEMKNDSSSLKVDADTGAVDDDTCVEVVSEEWSARAWLVDGTDGLIWPIGRVGETAERPRFGATVVAGGLQGPQRALIWGGNVDGDAGIADWYEPIDPGAGRTTREILNLVGDSIYGSSMFASGIFVNETSDGRYQFLILGGSDVSVGADGPEYSVASETSRAELVTVNPATLTFVSDAVNVSSLLHDIRRATARLIPLRPSAQDLWLMGGFTSFTADEDACPGRDVCLQEDMLRFKLVEDPAGPVGSYALEGISSLDLPVGSFGAEPGQLADGSWLLVGGMENVTSSTDAISTDAALVRYDIEESGFCDLSSSPP